MKKALVRLALPVVVLAGCSAGEVEEPEPAAPAAAAPTAADLAFRNAVGKPPDGWPGPTFELSHDYPREFPGCDAPWLERDVRFDDPHPTWSPEWQGYVQDIVDYVVAGQDPQLPNEVGWRAEVDGTTRWFHIPWMAFDGQRGREFVHGLTNELSTALSTFLGPGRGSGIHTLPGGDAAGDEPLFETWSVGFYNPCGAWSVGQGWPASGEPETYTDPESGRMFARGLPFREGTVVVKVLTTTADESYVPYLKGSPAWQANAHVQTGPSTYSTCDRKVRTVHLVQMDLAVVDERSPTRWVYSTLVYDGTHGGATVWDRMRPLGVEWGSDHRVFPAVPEDQSGQLRETIVAPIDLFEHYGCNGRLAGPVDQATSSCVTCHMGAYSAAPGVLQVQGQNIPAIFNFDGICTTFNEANAAYFSDYAYPAPYPDGRYDDAIPLDSSLQLQVAFAQYAVYENPDAPRTCPDAGTPPNGSGS